MFKKTLIAVALAAVSTGAMAVDVSATGAAADARTYGSEALTTALVANDASAISLKPVTLTLGAEYTVGDTVTINLTGAEFKTAGAYTLTSVAATGAGAGTDTVAFGLLSQSATELLFRVTAITPGASSNSSVLKNIVTLSDTSTAAATASGVLVNDVLVKLNSTAAKSEVTVAANAKTSTGLVIDKTAKDSVVVGKVITQHTFEITKMAAKIDVSKSRKEFVTPADAKFVVTHVNANPDQAKFGTATSKAKATIQGSMVGFEESLTTTDNNGTVKGTAGDYTVAKDLQSASFDIATAEIELAKAIPAQTVVFAVDSTPADRTVINASNYTFSVDLIEGGKTVTVSGLDVGSMTLNGASKTFGYVPVNFDGAVVSQFEIGNKGTVDGEISITAFDRDGVKHSAVLPFKATAGKMTKLSDSDISTAFGLTKGASLNLTITVNAPESDITVAGYSNRGTTGRMSLSSVN
ncbi:hypothetical protein [Shewanella frigidimarina]|uniref:hypothetical protein n=1 Tax=Shewanella frigidimarina TaxID=56812 RepID=UPI003D7B80B1